MFTNFYFTNIAGHDNILCIICYCLSSEKMKGRIFMKKGYTLAELLLTVGIIGVVTAILLPISIKLKPDKTKTGYIRVHDSISTAVRDLASDSKLFLACDRINGTDISCLDHPLFSTETSKTTSSGYNVPSGRTKLCRLLADELGIQQGTLNCRDSYYNYADNTFANNVSFVTKKGESVIVTTDKSYSGGRGTYQTDIYFDVNGTAADKGPNCIYNAQSCPKPDRYKLMVSAAGDVVAADPIGELYLNTRKNWKNKNLTPAAGASVKAALDNDLRSFVVPSCSTQIVEEPPVWTPPAGTYGFNCMQKGSNPWSTSYAGCNSGTIYMDKYDNSKMAYHAAENYCKSKGGYMPQIDILALAIQKYNSQLNFTTGNYWAEAQSSSKGTREGNCYAPDGNCGWHEETTPQNFRCAYDEKTSNTAAVGGGSSSSSSTPKKDSSTYGSGSSSSTSNKDNSTYGSGNTSRGASNTGGTTSNSKGGSASRREGTY